MTDTAFPHMYRIRQVLTSTPIDRPGEAVRQLVRSDPAIAVIQPGMRVAVTAGSRGIANITAILSGVIAELKASGAEPFVVPSMGSHGYATAEGQIELLASLGITESSVGAPIRSSMEVVELGKTEDGVAVFCDKLAFGADKIVVVGRVKPHTSFRAPNESGLLKMVVVGLGKRHGADALHTAPNRYDSLPKMARVALAKMPIAFGVAIVEDSLDRTTHLQVVLPKDFEAEDRKLLVEARRLMPRIPFERLDVLIVDEMGKNVSGTGMDPNVIGMGRRTGGASIPDIDRIAVLDLTEASHGNAVGIGMADVTTRRLVDKIDFRPTYMNAMTAGSFIAVKVPMTLETDREAISAVLRGYSVETIRLARIKNTLLLEEMEVSAGLLDAVRQDDCLDVLQDLGPMTFGAAGDLLR